MRAVGNGTSYGGIPISDFRVVSDTEITARTSIRSVAETGHRDVTVATPQGTGTASDAFSVNEIGSRVHLDSLEVSLAVIEE